MGEIEACLKDMFGSFRQSVASVPECSALSADDLARGAPLDFSSEACRATYPKCPSFTKQDEPAQPELPSVVACNEACAARNAQCESDIECKCSIEYAVFHEAPFGKTYYDKRLAVSWWLAPTIAVPSDGLRQS